jgi:hypothetical protein
MTGEGIMACLDRRRKACSLEANSSGGNIAREGRTRRSRVPAYTSICCCLHRDHQVHCGFGSLPFCLVPSRSGSALGLPGVADGNAEQAAFR